MIDKFNEKFKELLNSNELKYLFKNSSYKLIFEALSISLSFIISWYFANTATVEFYGKYLFILNVLAFFSFLSFSGIKQSMIQYVAKDYDMFFITSINKTIKYSILGSISLVLYTIIYTLFFEYDFVILICLIINAFFFPILSINDIYEYFLEGKTKFKKAFFLRLLFLIIQNLFLLLLIILLKNLIYYFLLFYTIQTVLNILVINSCKNLIKTKEKKHTLEKEALNYGFFLTKIKIFTIISSNINSIIIATFYSPSILALYVIGIRLPYIATRFVNTGLSVLLPKYSRKEYQKISKKIFLFVGIISILLFTGSYLGLPIFIEVLFPKYIDSINYGRFYAVILLIYPLNCLLNYYFRGKIEKDVIKKSKIFPELLNLILLFPAFLFLGIYGLIIAELSRFVFKVFIYGINYLKIEKN